MVRICETQPMPLLEDWRPWTEAFALRFLGHYRDLTARNIFAYRAKGGRVSAYLKSTKWHEVQA